MFSLICKTFILFIFFASFSSKEFLHVREYIILILYNNFNSLLIAEKQRLFNEYQSASNEKKAEMEKRYGKRQLQTMIENAMSENWINDNSHNCPHCKTAIEVLNSIHEKISCYNQYCTIYIVIYNCCRNRMAVIR